MDNGRVTEEKAYAKLNLTLDILGKRPDGYHDMVMVMQTVSVCDRIRIARTEAPGIRLSCNYHYIPTDGRNLAVRAAGTFLERVGAGEADGGLEIAMEKDIPVGAGMAGGSADAAAVLRGLNRLFGSPLDRKELEKLSEAVGSDVAFCVAGGTALAKGRGERLEDLPPMPDCSIAVCKPDFSISTPELFRKLDQKSVRHHPDTEGVLRAIREGDLRELSRRLYNVFEETDDRRLRTVAEIRGTMLDHGALGAVMTGTGSAVFGLFEKKDPALACVRELEKEHGFARMAEPVGRIGFEQRPRD